jgi:hypothetical protein
MPLEKMVTDRRSPALGLREIGAALSRGLKTPIAPHRVIEREIVRIPRRELCPDRLHHLNLEAQPSRKHLCLTLKDGIGALPKPLA